MTSEQLYSDRFWQHIARWLTESTDDELRTYASAVANEWSIRGFDADDLCDIALNVSEMREAF